MIKWLRPTPLVDSDTRLAHVQAAARTASVLAASGAAPLAGPGPTRRPA